MNTSAPEPNSPQPDNPNPAPVHPPVPLETRNPKSRLACHPRPNFPVPSGSRMLCLAATTLLCWPGALGVAAAQTSNGNGDSDRSNPCQVEPGNQNEGTERNNEGEARPRPSLEDCNGVLTLPRTGDPEIEERPSDTGTTPVIPPGAVPGQPPD